jgi:glycosyltransferase involved in cell wall biosynthesis
MAKITFLGNFRVDYTTETHHTKTLESMGHQVIKLQESEATSEDVLNNAISSDLFVWVHTHGWNTPGRITMQDTLLELKKHNIPSMTYHLDLWLGLNRQKDLRRKPVYQYIDHFFTVDSKMADWFNSNTSVKGHYLPAGVYDKECTYTRAAPGEEVIFVGSKTYHPEWPYRPKLINFLSQTYGARFNLYGREGRGLVRGHELNNLYASTKVVVGDTLCPNFTYPDYWSDRIYETLGRGGFLIHPYIKGLEKEFEDKKHVVFYEYNNLDQLKQLVDYYLEHEEEREEIRKSGHELVKNNYTYKNRWEHILKEILK